MKVIAFKEREGTGVGGEGILISEDISFSIPTFPEVKIFYKSGKGYWMEGTGCLRAEGENRPSRPGHVVVVGCDLYNGQIPGDTACCLNAESCSVAGHSGPSVMVKKAICYPINTMVASHGGRDDMRTCFGIGEPDDPQFTISAAHCHAVCYETKLKGAEASNSIICLNDQGGGS